MQSLRDPLLSVNFNIRFRRDVALRTELAAIPGLLDQRDRVGSMLETAVSYASRRRDGGLTPPQILTYFAAGEDLADLPDTIARAGRAAGDSTGMLPAFLTRLHGRPSAAAWLRASGDRVLFMDDMKSAVEIFIPEGRASILSGFTLYRTFQIIGCFYHQNKRPGMPNVARGFMRDLTIEVETWERSQQAPPVENPKVESGLSAQPAALHERVVAPAVTSGKAKHVQITSVPTHRQATQSLGQGKTGPHMLYMQAHQTTPVASTSQQPSAQHQSHRRLRKVGHSPTEKPLSHKLTRAYHANEDPLPEQVLDPTTGQAARGTLCTVLSGRANLVLDPPGGYTVQTFPLTTPAPYGMDTERPYYPGDYGNPPRRASVASSASFPPLGHRRHRLGRIGRAIKGFALNCFGHHTSGDAASRRHSAGAYAKRDDDRKLNTPSRTYTRKHQIWHNWDDRWTRSGFIRPETHRPRSRYEDFAWDLDDRDEERPAYDRSKPKHVTRRRHQQYKQPLRGSREYETKSHRREVYSDSDAGPWEWTAPSRRRVSTQHRQDYRTMPQKRHHRDETPDQRRRSHLHS